MEQLNNLDVVFLIIIGISALVGIARGMTKEILSICGWVLAAVSTFYLTPIVNPITKQYIASDLLSNLVSGMAVLIVFCIIWILIEDKIAAIIRQSKLSALDRLFGFVFGAARGALIVVLVALMMSTLLPDSSKSGMFAESKIFNVAAQYVEPVKSMIPQSWIDGIKEKTASLTARKAEEEKTEAAKKEEPKASENKPAENKAPEAAQEQPSNIDANNQTEPAATDATANAESSDNALQENLDVLQKTGEELFKQLAQPKPAAEATEGEGEPAESDLDKLLDVLEDKITSTDFEVINNAAQQVSNTVIDTLAESVADKVADRVAAKAAATTTQAAPADAAAQAAPATAQK
ncbi:MAG: CvpA family protein [Alphaproteobacteria bacterium]|nr:CvpA family protein [Alphaproteobacteria bacterium]